jgi:two-component sensor histidine kinase
LTPLVWRAAREPTDARVEAGFRFAAVQMGYWLGWASIVVVLTGLALDDAPRHRWLVVGAILFAAAGNTVAMLAPWREWLADRRGRFLLDAWCGGLIAFVALLAAGAGSSFTLLLFFVVPFIAVVQAGWRRGFWLATSVGTCATIAVLVPLSAGATVIRLMLVAVAVAVALVLSRAIRLEAARYRLAADRAELERTLTREASHRVKNDLQAAADFLLLARPAGAGGTAFDETAARLGSIAIVHELLSERGDGVDGAELLRRIAAAVSAPVDVQADPVRLDAATAQKLGIVANELLANAVRHGAPPIAIRLEAGEEVRLRVTDAGGGAREVGSGLGLSLVERLVEQGLGGRFVLTTDASLGTRADVVCPRPQ